MSLLRDFCWNIQASFQISCELLVRAGFFLDVGKKTQGEKKLKLNHIKIKTSGFFFPKNLKNLSNFVNISSKIKTNCSKNENKSENSIIFLKLEEKL